MKWGPSLQSNSTQCRSPGEQASRRACWTCALAGSCPGDCIPLLSSSSTRFFLKILAGRKNNRNKISRRILKPLFERKSKKHTLEIIIRISPFQSHLQRGRFMRLKSWGYPSHWFVLQFLFLPVWGLMQDNGAEDSLPVLCWTRTTTVGTRCFFLENVTSLDFPMLPWTPFSCAKEQLWIPSQMSVTPNGTRNFQ